MKKTWLITILVSAAMLTACQETLEERCEREARDYTKKHCPTPIDAYTVMDSMTFDRQTHTIAYNYTFKDKLDDSAFIATLNPSKALLEQLKNSTHLKLYKEAGYNFRYTYFSTKKKGSKVFEATFKEKDYR